MPAVSGKHAISRDPGGAAFAPLNQSTASALPLKRYGATIRALPASLTSSTGTVR